MLGFKCTYRNTNFDALKTLFDTTQIVTGSRYLGGDLPGFDLQASNYMPNQTQFQRCMGIRRPRKSGKTSFNISKSPMGVESYLVSGEPIVRVEYWVFRWLGLFPTDLGPLD